MAKIDLIIESIRDEYMINLLEESEISELQTLKTKKFLTESLGRIRSALIEEGALDGVKQHLANNWGKYLAGGAAGGALANGMHTLDSGLSDYTNAVGQAYDQSGIGAAAGMAVGAPLATMGVGAIDAGENALETGAQFDQEGLTPIGDKLVDAAGNIYDQAGQVIGNIADQVQNAVQ